MANLVITWDANEKDQDEVFDVLGQKISDKKIADPHLSILREDGLEILLTPGCCTSIDTSFSYTIKVGQKSGK